MQVPAIMLAAALLAQAPAPLNRSELLGLADAGYALTLAEACGAWGDARWFAEVRRRIHLLVAHGTPSRGDRALFDGAFAMAERRGREQAAMLGRIACRGVAESGGSGPYDRLLADDRLDGSREPPATRD